MNQPSCCLTYFGHSTVLVEMDRQRALTDSILRSHVGPLPRAAAPVDARHWSDITTVLTADLAPATTVRVLQIGGSLTVEPAPGATFSG